MGRSLTNAMVNLGIDSSVEEAIYEVSHVQLVWAQKGPGSVSQYSVWMYFCCGNLFICG